MSQTAANLEKALLEMFRRESAFEDACMDLASAEHIFKMKQAKQIKLATGTVDEKKATALIECEVEHSAYKIAEAVKEALKEKLRDAQAAVSARQSILSAEAKGNFGYAVSGTTT